MEKYYKSKPVQTGRGMPSDQDLLDIIESNVRRLPGNDNSVFVKQERLELGLVSSLTSALAFAGILVLAVVVMAIFKLVPSTQDSHY